LTRLYTRRVPYTPTGCISGIIASIVLAGSRAVGETMVVLIAAGRTPNLTFDPT
jgi:ABC-type phosphate transport system permease subunit